MSISAGDDKERPNASCSRATSGEVLVVAEEKSDCADLLLVGIGASAGGLEAFRELLQALPSQPNMALVYVQPHSPSYDRLLVHLLSNTTCVPVVEITDAMAIEPRRVYVAPPNGVVSIRGNTLYFEPQPVDAAPYAPIDYFFQSLAAQHGSRAVGVILSGTGADGSSGLRTIKEAGGITFAQDPGSARCAGMPQAAIATNRVDHVLSPGEIGQELAVLSDQYAHPFLTLAAGKDPLLLEPRHLERIFAALHSACNVDFSRYKLSTVERRIQRRMSVNKVVSADQYLAYLESNRSEVAQLHQDVLIHVTRFFRDPDSYAALTQEVFPKLMESRQPEAPLRIWVPGCSSGEEPYSLAIALREFLDARQEHIPVQIFATDVNEAAVARARVGVYPSSIEEDVAPARIRKNFAVIDGQYRIHKAIRDICVFARHDLTCDPPFSRLDLIMCRNVLIYLGPAVQSRLINMFHYALRSTGFLMLGGAETTGQHADLFSVVDKRFRIFRKKMATDPAEIQVALPYDRPVTEKRPTPMDDVRSGGSIQSELSRVILEHYSPAGVVVNEELRIVQFRGQTGKFLEPASGDASLHLLKMCREGLLHGVRTALQNARKNNTWARRDGLQVVTQDGHFHVGVEVVPLSVAGQGPHYAIFFREQEGHLLAPRRGARKRSGAPSESSPEGEVDRLRSELVASREYLQSIIQDLGAANEELQSANEEILSSNEELQSTNEELDTAKEELQSTNEELNTLNEELHGRNEELARINSDLMNLLNGVRVAIVIVASDLRIRRFTPMAEKVLNLIAGDVGRPISQIKPNINCPDLEKLVEEVIDSVSVQHREVQDHQGHWYALTIRPYKNVDNRIDGAVLTLFDIDETRRHESRSAEAREYAQGLLATVHEPVMVLDSEQRVRTVNHAFCSCFHVAALEFEGKALGEVAQVGWNMPSLGKLVEEILQTSRTQRRYELRGKEMRGEFDRLGTKTFVVNACRLGDADGAEPLLLLAFEHAVREATERNP
jgi:two-component system CheB/CheR fusion protein